MKITDIKITDPVYIPIRQTQDAINTLPTVSSYSFCQIFTDDGVTGLGLARSGNLYRVFVEEILKPYIIGEDPMNNERIWSKMYWATLQEGRRGAAINAISMVDVAIWDLKGKITNQPVNRLLGGYRDKVPSYGSGIDINYTSDELVKEMSDYVKEGFKIVKMKIGKRDPKEDLERVKLVRKTIGPDTDLCLDVNNGWSIHTAIEMAKRLEEYDIYWLEEPILADEIDNLAKLARETTIPIAVGENHYTKWEFKDLMEHGAVEVVQADIWKCGGPTEFLKIAAMADAYGLPVCPHHTEFIDVPLIAAIPNGLFHEYIKEFFEPMTPLFRDHVKPENGEVAPLNKPGFGIELNMDSVKRLGTRPSPDKLRRTVLRGWRWPPYL